MPTTNIEKELKNFFQDYTYDDGKLASFYDKDVYEWLNPLIDLIHSYEQKAEIKTLEYILSEPTGSQIMTIEQMKDTSDNEWRDKVIGYFFNTDSLRFKLMQRISELKEGKKDA